MCVLALSMGHQHASAVYADTPAILAMATPVLSAQTYSTTLPTVEQRPLFALLSPTVQELALLATADSHATQTTHPRERDARI
jgi:hypothetical protein